MSTTSSAVTIQASNIFWSLPTQGDSRYLGTDIGGRSVDLTYLRQIAQAADSLGYFGVLLPTGRSCEDPWVIASALAPLTERLRFLVAVQPKLLSPTIAARMSATLDRISDGRLLINVMAGDDPVEDKGDNVSFADDERCELTRDFLASYIELLAGRAVNGRSRYLAVEDRRLRFSPIQRPRPPLYFSGSAAADQFVAGTIDKYLIGGAPPAQVAARIARVKALAEWKGRQVTFGMRVDVIVRETMDEAWAAAGDLIRYVDSETFGRSHRDRLEVSPNLWTGVGLVRGGASTALVGDPETVAARMKEYMALGIDSFILSGYPHLEEAYRFAELVMSDVARPTAQRRLLAWHPAYQITSAGGR